MKNFPKHNTQTEGEEKSTYARRKAQRNAPTCKYPRLHWMFLTTRIKHRKYERKHAGGTPIGVLSISGAVHCGANRKQLGAAPSSPSAPKFFLSAPMKLDWRWNSPGFALSPTNLLIPVVCSRQSAISVNTRQKQQGKKWCGIGCTTRRQRAHSALLSEVVRGGQIWGCWIRPSGNGYRLV